MSMLRITVDNLSPNGGTFLTPFWFGLHDGSFDLGAIGSAASAGLEALAEDGTFGAINAELAAADADGQGGAVFGEAGPIATQEVASTLVSLDADATPYISLAAMILPSNDAFIGTLNALQLFDDDGDFVGTTTVTFDGSRVYDAGTEVNTELDAAFINQMGPNTGETENGVITRHPGFNGSEGNPDGEQIILGGTNAAGAEIDPTAADFTIEGAQIAQITIEEVVELRVTATNTSPDGGTFLTPFWFGLHDDGFDLGDRGEAASAGLEALAEDGTFAAIDAELAEADEDGVAGAILGVRGPIATGEVASTTIVASTSTPYISLAAMLLPSNDAFVGTLDAIRLFDDNGDYIGDQQIVFTGENVYDAGTEVNTELDAAFINQMGPNTGETEDGVIALHSGFNGSQGNPEGEQIILGGTNAFGVDIDPTAADFTIEGAQIAEISIEQVMVELGSGADDAFEVTNFDSAARIAGNGGADEVTFAGTDFSDVTLGRIDGGFSINTADGSALHISGVETLAFDDQTLAIETGGTTQTVGLFYQTLLGRDSDVAGLTFWNGVGEGDFGLDNVAEAILASDEFTGNSGTLAANGDFVDFLYQSALGRDADQEGRDFWLGVLDSGAADRGDVAVGFATAEETLGVFSDVVDNGFVLFA
ncbi:MAG: spondin domain-containing protein [Sulfitobacter sp.]